MWTCVVIKLCGDWQRGTHVDGRVMGSNHKCHSPLVMYAFHHTPQYTRWCCTPTWLHDSWESGWPHCVDHHIIPNHTLHHQLCAGQHSHSTLHSCRLLSPLNKDMLLCVTRVPWQRAVLHVMPCHLSAITSARANGLRTTCHYLTVCVLPIQTRTQCETRKFTDPSLHIPLSHCHIRNADCWYTHGNPQNDYEYF